MDAIIELPAPEALFRELRSSSSNRHIELAAAAWTRQECKIPCKAHFILEWLLERLLKTRSDA